MHTLLNKDSKQLGTPPSKIAEQEKTLLLIIHFRLAQLSTGCCTMLKFDLSRICDNVDNRSPKCDVAPTEVNHIFSCNKKVTNLKVTDTGERPVEVAKWLDLLPSVLHNHKAQNNLGSLSLSPGDDDSPLGPPNPVILQGVDAEKSSHQKKLWIGSHTLIFDILFINLEKTATTTS